MLTLWQRPFRDVSGIVKRGEDVLIAGAALVLLSPILLLTALLVRLSSPGPIFFVEPRIGFNNELIKVLKFRTMYVEQSDLKAEQTTTAGDPRITPIGRTPTQAQPRRAASAVERHPRRHVAHRALVRTQRI